MRVEIEKGNYRLVAHGSSMYSVEELTERGWEVRTATADRNYAYDCLDNVLGLVPKYSY
jgi:hypothetical protein